MRRAPSVPLFALFVPLLFVACDGGPSSPALAAVTPSAASAAAKSEAPPEDVEGEACRRRVAEVLERPASEGAPAFEAARVEILGRARGEPLVLVREPKQTPKSALEPRLVASSRLYEKERPGGRVAALRKRHKGDPRALRALVLREGYAYASDPQDALALVTQIALPDLFDEPRIVLEREKPFACSSARSCGANRITSTSAGSSPICSSAIAWRSRRTSSAAHCTATSPRSPTRWASTGRARGT